MRGALEQHLLRDEGKSEIDLVTDLLHRRENKILETFLRVGAFAHNMNLKWNVCHGRFHDVREWAMHFGRLALLVRDLFD